MKCAREEGEGQSEPESGARSPQRAHMAFTRSTTGVLVRIADASSASKGGLGHRSPSVRGVDWNAIHPPDVAQALADLEIRADRWRDVQRGLGKEPEGHDGEDNADDKGVISASRRCRNRRRHHFARYANAAITRVWVPVDSVGSMTGAKNSE